MAAAGAAYADEPTSDVSEVVISGYRSSLQEALELKREETVASDSILAEDIGKFPDLNLSEAIQRIPGVALARDAGEGRQISVRGLGPQFTRVRINGLEALTTAGGTDAAGLFPAAEGIGDHPCQALRNQSILPMRRYHLWPRPAKTSSIFGAPANSTIRARSGRRGSHR